MTCESSFGFETFIGQLLALVTFFAFPALQYILLKRFAKNEGRPELWYLPSYGYRLVIRNIPNKKTLSDIKSRTFLRQSFSSNSGSSVATLQDKLLIDKEDFFLLPGYDQVLISFKLSGQSNNRKFIQTDKLGNTISEFDLNEIDELISDYVANIENLLNFDIRISKRVIIDKKDLEEYCNRIKESPIEQKLNIKKVIDIG